MNHDHPQIKNRQFDEFVVFCLEVSTNRLNQPNDVKLVILYHVFFYTLIESRVLIDEENLTNKSSFASVKKFPETFKLFEYAELQEYYIPEIYAKLSALIHKHLPDLPLYLLGGYFYEKLLGRKIEEKVILDKQFKKNNGIFYTPQATAELFITELFDQYTKEKKDFTEIMALDLACGCGIFSLIYLQKLTTIFMTKLKKEYIEKSDFQRDLTGKDFQTQETLVKLSILKNNLHALDQDETALEITRFSLLLYCLMGEKEIISLKQFLAMCATLKENIKYKDIIKFYKDNSINKPVMPIQKFDIVFSNPPYIAYYSRHSKLSQPLEKDLPVMKQNLLFSDFDRLGKKKTGRYNSVMFFLDYAIRVSSPGAYLAFLIDMNIHESLFFGFRNWILENLTLLKTRINISDFPGVLSGQSSIYLQNKLQTDRQEVEIEDDRNHEKSRILQETLKNNSMFYIRKSSDLINQLDCFPQLGKFCRISTGVNIGGASRHFVTSRNDGESFYPFIASSDLKAPYDLKFNCTNMYIHYDKRKADLINKESKLQGKKNIIALGQLTRFIEPRLFVRQSAPRIIAGYCQEAVVSPYSIFVINGSGVYNLLVLLGILNSDLISYYSIQKGLIRLGLGKQPQIRKSSLQAIPVPDEQKYNLFKDQITCHVQEILNVQDLQKKEADPGINRTVAECREKIEKLVCAMYEVNYEKFSKEKISTL